MNHFTSNKLLQKKVLVLIITKQVKLYIKTNLTGWTWQNPTTISYKFIKFSFSIRWMTEHDEKFSARITSENELHFSPFT